MTRADQPSDPAAAVRALRACRDAMTEVHREVRPTGPIYHAASMVTAAIDAFATLLTGERYYFGIGGSTGNAGVLEAEEDKRAREAGKKPWDAEQ